MQWIWDLRQAQPGATQESSRLGPGLEHNKFTILAMKRQLMSWSDRVLEKKQGLSRSLTKKVGPAKPSKAGPTMSRDDRH